jgi:septation ring formation regulator EzrA
MIYTDKVMQEIGAVSKRQQIMESNIQSFKVDVEKQLGQVQRRQQDAEQEIVSLKEEQRTVRQITNGLVDQFQSLDRTVTKAMENIERQGRTDYVKKTLVAVMAVALILLIFLR